MNFVKYVTRKLDCYPQNPYSLKQSPVTSYPAAHKVYICTQAHVVVVYFYITPATKSGFSGSDVVLACHNKKGVVTNVELWSKVEYFEVCFLEITNVPV